MPLFAVRYIYSDATAAQRDTVRPEHRAWLSGLVDQGVVRSSGPFVDGSGALVIVEAADADALSARLEEDPFAKAKLIEAVRFDEWRPVLGAMAD